MAFIKKILQAFKSQEIELVSIEEEAQNAFSLHFEKPNVDFKAGQHFVFTLKHDNPDNRKSFRIFSISSAPSDKYFTITTRYFGEKSSSFKRALMNMKPGDKISVKGPSPIGDVYTIKDYSIPYVFITGGIGITPFISILRDECTNQRGLKGVLFYANRDEDFIFGKQIDEKINQLENIQIKKVVSPNRFKPNDFKDVYTDLGENTVFNISGTVKFVDHYSDVLKQAGISSKSINAYKYRGIFGSY